MIEIARRQLDQPIRQFEACWMRHLERRREFHGAELLADSLGDFAATVAGIDAPQAGDGIEDLAPIGCPVVHAFGACEQTRLGLELAIRGERHPERFEVGGGRLGRHGSSSALTIKEWVRTE